MSNAWSQLAALAAAFLLGWAASLVWRSRDAGAAGAAAPAAGAAGAGTEPASARLAEQACAAAEARAAAAEERYQQALATSLDGMWEWRLSPERVQLSPRWKGMLGFGAEELAHTREAWLGRVHAEDRAGFCAALERAVDGAAAAAHELRLEHEMRLVHRDGSVRHVLSRALVVRDDAGRAARVVGLDTDVTRLKRVQGVLDAVADGTALAHGERFFPALAEHFARALQVDYAFVTECADQPATRVRTLACWSATEGARPPFEYELAGTPCEEVIHGSRTCFYPERLAERFPREAGWEAYVGLPIVASDGRVLGHLALMNKSRLGDEVLVERVYRIFLARAAAEMERLQALARLDAAPSTGRQPQRAAGASTSRLA